MTGLRRLGGRIALGWLLSHAATLALVPAILATGSAEALLECTCAHGDHTICPMHHRPAPGTERCAMRGGDNVDVAVMTGLFGIVALVPASAVAPAPELARASAPAPFSANSLRPTPPDPPPPRG